MAGAGNLLSQLTGGGQHQHAGAEGRTLRPAPLAAAAPAVLIFTGFLMAGMPFGHALLRRQRHPLQGRQQEGGRLAGAGRGGCHQIPAREQHGNGLQLHRRGVNDVQPLQGLHQRVDQAQFGKAGIGGFHEGIGMQRRRLILFVVFIAIRIVVAVVIGFIVQPDTGIQHPVFVAVVWVVVVIFVVAAFIVEVVVTGAIRSGFITGRIVVVLIVPGIDDVFIAGTEDLCIFGILTFCIDGLSVFGIIAFGADGRCRVIQALAGRVIVHAVVSGAAGTACVTSPQGLFLRHLRCFMFQAALQIVTGLAFLLLVFHDLLCTCSFRRPTGLVAAAAVSLFAGACHGRMRPNAPVFANRPDVFHDLRKTPCSPENAVQPCLPPLRTLQRVCSPLLHTPSAPGVPRVAGCSPHPNGTATGTNARQRPREPGRTVGRCSEMTGRHEAGFSRWKALPCAVSVIHAACRHHGLWVPCKRCRGVPWG